MIEILAPAGAEEQLIAAVRSGADAVYLGTKNFNARASAGNFDAAALRKAVAYCHARGVRVHVTLNTLVRDDELPALRQEIEEIARCGVDAVIVQDLAVAGMLRKICPTLERHASTQMALHNPEGVQAAEKLGFSRAVLAREMSAEEIKKTVKKTGIEIECFVHGALCMSASGTCYLSSVIGGRSGNRGKCAQPCRLDFQLDKKNYALSLKDMSYAEHVQELAEAGVCSLKIEGRMKRPEYVAGAVDAIKTARDGGTPDMNFLKAVFSRSGFTDGYYRAKRNSEMFGIRTKEDVRAAEKALGMASALYRNEYQRIPVEFVLYLTEDRPAVLVAEDGKYTVTAEGAIPERAIRQPLTKETAAKSLSKLGGTPFYCADVALQSGNGLTIPAAELNHMRRECAEKLMGRRSEILPHSVHAWDYRPERYTPGKAKLRLRFARYEQCFENDAELIILPLAEVRKNTEKCLVRFGNRLACEIPILCYDTEKLRGELRELYDKGVRSVVAENIGALKIAKDMGFTVHGGSGLNILNTLALEEYAAIGLEDATVSFELSANHIAELGGTLKRGILGYGRLPLMQLRACPARGKSGCEKNCPGKMELTDRKNRRFLLLCREKKFSTLYNCVPLYIGDRKERFPVDFFTLYFTDETKKQAEAVYWDFNSGKPYHAERTKGLYFREVE